MELRAITSDKKPKKWIKSLTVYLSYCTALVSRQTDNVPQYVYQNIGVQKCFFGSNIISQNLTWQGSSSMIYT